MGRILGYFVRGLVLVVPLAVTVWACWWVVTTVDGLLGLKTKGVGFVLTIGLITLVGFLGTSLITRSAVVVLERLLARLPLVRLLYSATKDLLNAFVGEKRRFDQPVAISLVPGSGMRMFGFVTQDSLAHLGLDGMVSVYCPHSYAWAGQMVAVPTDMVQPLDQSSADVMAFIVSGGVTRFPTPTAELPAANAADRPTP